VADQIERTAALRAANQAALIRFLSTDIDIAFTFIESARNAGDLDHARDLIAKARLALESIRHWAGHIEDPLEWHKIHLSTNKLENAINAFPN
jgi:hypothetical protein